MNSQYFFKILFTFFIFSVSCKTLAGKNIVLDTIYANDKKNVALFFPEPIRQAITGASNFVFTYNREQEQYFGLLKANPGQESNLLVLSKNGLVFSYIIKYRDRIDKLNYFIGEDERIGTEKPQSTSKKSKPKKQQSTKNEIKNFSAKLLKDQHPDFRQFRKRSQKIKLSVENIVYQEDILYFVMNIENRSSLDYDINYLNLLIETRKKGKRKSMQRLYQQPVSTYKMPHTVKAHSSQRIVYALRKFSLGNDRRMVIRLNEQGGGRNLNLNVSHRRINNPN